MLTENCMQNISRSFFRSYAEICYPLLERLNFLLTEVLPPPLGFLETARILRPKNRWRVAFDMLKKRNFDVENLLQRSNDMELKQELTKLKKVLKLCSQ